MDKYNILVIAVLTTATLVGASPFILDNTVLNHQDQEFEANALVMGEELNQSEIGIDVDRNLNYGELPKGTNSTKYLNISTSKTVMVEVSSDGNVSDYLDYDNRHYFSGQKDIPLKFIASTPGNYTGQVRLDIQVPENGAGENWLELKNTVFDYIEKGRDTVSSI